MMFHLKTTPAPPHGALFTAGILPPALHGFLCWFLLYLSSLKVFTHPLLEWLEGTEVAAAQPLFLIKPLHPSASPLSHLQSELDSFQCFPLRLFHDPSSKTLIHPFFAAIYIRIGGINIEPLKPEINLYQQHSELFNLNSELHWFSLRLFLR